LLPFGARLDGFLFRGFFACSSTGVQSRFSRARYAAGSRCEPIKMRRRSIAAESSAAPPDTAASSLGGEEAAGGFSAALAGASTGLIGSLESVNVTACPLDCHKGNETSQISESMLS
jgi:hypothetical protein